MEHDIFKTLVRVWKALSNNKSHPSRLWFCAPLPLATRFCSHVAMAQRPTTVRQPCLQMPAVT